jgi:tetratricopeptide (TPR) repeat protein
MPAKSPFHAVRTAAALACALALAQGAFAQKEPDPKEPASTVDNSALDAPMFYQLLIGELEFRAGESGTAFQVLLDAARKTKDEALFRRATDIALQARAGDQALQAVQAWRTATPNSMDALRYQIQLLIALNKQAETVEPLRTMLQLTPMPERPGMIASLPRLFVRSGDRKQSVKLLEKVLQPSLAAPETKVAAQVALGRAALAAGDAPRALELAQSSHALDPAAEAPALLALELLSSMPAAEEIVTAHLQAKPASTPIRLTYARVLAGAQRYGDAIPQLEAVTRSDPQLAAPWLTLGALQLELDHPAEATAVLTQYLKQSQANPPATGVPQDATTEEDDDDNDPATTDQGLTQAYLLLAQAAERQRDYAGAEAWLAKVTSPQRALDVQSRRASMLAKQGKIKEARELIRRTPEKSSEDARAKLLAEAQLLRDAKQWAEANNVLAAANAKFPNDADLLYEQSMMAEKLNHMDEMERLLRRVIEIKPDHHHAYNALGYSLAERNLRLTEARGLIQKALDLAPGEPFITDSLGWVEYRMGNRSEALRLLQQAYKSRPDVEIGAHLGEVLWVNGQRDEARRVLRDARSKDSNNDVLKEMLTRLRVDL